MDAFDDQRYSPQKLALCSTEIHKNGQSKWMLSWSMLSDHESELMLRKFREQIDLKRRYRFSKKWKRFFVTTKF